MTPAHAQAIIDGFRADGKCLALPKEIFGGEFFNFKQRIQTWLPSFNKRVSDAIWDGNTALAFKILVSCPYKRPVEERNADSRYVSAAKGRYGTHADHGNILVESDFKKNYSSDWHTVKAVRSRTKAKYRG